MLKDGSSILRLWPLILVTASIVLVRLLFLRCQRNSNVLVGANKFDYQQLELQLLFAISAGVWEELSFRWLYILPFMLFWQLVTAAEWLLLPMLSMLFIASAVLSFIQSQGHQPSYEQSKRESCRLTAGLIL